MIWWYVAIGIAGAVLMGWPHLKKVVPSINAATPNTWPSDKEPTAEVISYLDAINNACPTAGCSAKWNLTRYSPMQAAIEFQKQTVAENPTVTGDTDAQDNKRSGS